MSHALDAKAKQPVAGRLAAVASALIDGIVAQRLFLGSVAIYCLGGLLLATVLGPDAQASLGLYNGPWLMLLGLYVIGCLAVVHPLHLILVERPARPLGALLRRWRRLILDRDRIGLAVPVLLALPLFISTFTSLKTLIPAINPYSWDPSFVALDRWLHGGADPWRLLQPWLGHPLATTVVNALYNAWFFVLAGMTFWQVFETGDRRTRTQYLVSLVLIWAILGNVLATVLASVGPCFYGRLVDGPDPFAPLMAYLRGAEAVHTVWAVAIQDRLWADYVADGLTLGSGISAMPSMHVATAVLFVCVGFRHARWIGWGLAAFALAILVGSVHLGWHYAIDGYAGALATLVLWRSVGRLLDRWPSLVG